MIQPIKDNEFPVFPTEYVATTYGKRIRKKAKEPIAYVRGNTRSGWRFRLANDPSELDHWKIFTSRAAAESAARVDYAETKLRKEMQARIDELQAELATARDAAKAQLDFGLCLDVVCNYRGPRGERWDVKLIGAQKA